MINRLTSLRALLLVILSSHIPLAIAAEPQPDKGTTPMSIVRYQDFGAKGDGKTDDIDAIIKAHAHANVNNLPVRADDAATYYIGGQDKTAIIQTDTDFGQAKFIIDDTAVEDRTAQVFQVRSLLEPIKPKNITSLRKNQPKIDLALPKGGVVIVTDKNVKRYIRFGLNQNNGTAQTDVFLVDKDGKVDPNTPILWDFDQITDLVVHPVDDKPLTIKGGVFTTIANGAESKYTYYSRGIAVRRSNVIIDGLTHLVTGEGEQGAPYAGFLSIGDCANVTVQNTVFTARKTRQTIGSAGKPVSMGSYAFTLNRAVNVSMINCTQTNDINDNRFWGIMGSNYSKNLSYDRCILSRFDAHQGVYNATIRNSTLGHMGILLIGRGTFLLENSTVHAGQLIALRSDYGSTWEGELIIRNSVYAPKVKRSDLNLIAGNNSGQHDFGYTCYMPERITIDNLRIEDAHLPASYKGPAIFANFNPEFTDDKYVQAFPYIITRRVSLKNVTTTSGHPVRVSDNPVMFKDVQVESTTDEK